MYFASTRKRRGGHVDSVLASPASRRMAIDDWHMSAQEKSEPRSTNFHPPAPSAAGGDVASHGSGRGQAWVVRASKMAQDGSLQEGIRWPPRLPRIAQYGSR